MALEPATVRAGDCMTAAVVVAHPEDSAWRAAELMLAHRVSGLPVVDSDNIPVGLVSEADFVFGVGEALEKRHETWLKMISGGQAISDDYLEMLQRELGVVRGFMARPAICVAADAPIEDVVKAMAEHRVRRVVVTRDGKLAGIITRRDLLRIARPRRAEPAAPAAPDPAPPRPALRPAPPPPPALAPMAAEFSAAGLRALAAAHERALRAAREHAATAAQQQREAEVAELLQAPLTEADWSAMLAAARLAAAAGETQCAILRFPASLCDDGGRAVNAPDPEWPRTLPGKAARVYLRWRDELQPLGFRLSSQIVSFPGGLPGDVEMSLNWRG